MIRRAFWLSVGAAAGIAGYRRASAVGRAVQVRVNGAAQLGTGQPAQRQPAQRQPAQATQVVPAPTSQGPAQAARPANGTATATQAKPGTNGNGNGKEDDEDWWTE